MEWERFKGYFHESWHPKMQKWIESEECDKIYRFLKGETKRGKKIAPLSTLTYKAFLDTPYNEMKVVLLGFSPYHTFYKDVAVADGLAFSCSITNRQQPSLTKFIEGVENDVYDGLNLQYDRKLADLTYLAKQGVLLFNSSLTTEKDKAGSHQNIWEPFTKFVLEECLAYTGIPIVFIGKDAQKYTKYVTPLTHGHIFEIEHPAAAARNNAQWDTQNVFKTVNQIIKQNNNYTIDWLDSVPF